MKRKAIFAALAATAAVTGTATTSLAGSTPVPEVAQVTVIHAATFSADSPFTVTVCANGNIVDDAFEVGQQLGPIPLPAGPLDVAVFGGTVTSCDGEPAIGGTFDVRRRRLRHRRRVGSQRSHRPDLRLRPLVREPR